jgi:hypothetical protein
MGKTSLGLAFTLFLLMAFNNFSKSGFQAIDVDSLGVASLSSQCSAKIKAESEVAFDSRVVCEDPSVYHCEQRSFRPDVANGTRDDHECMIVVGLGSICVPVKFMGFNTQAQLSSADPRDSAEGGSYNRDEFTCTNLALKDHGVALVESEGTSLVDALEKTFQQCQLRSQP